MVLFSAKARFSLKQFLGAISSLEICMRCIYLRPASQKRMYGKLHFFYLAERRIFVLWICWVFSLMNGTNLNVNYQQYCYVTETRMIGTGRHSKPQPAHRDSPHMLTRRHRGRSLMVNRAACRLSTEHAYVITSVRTSLAEWWTAHSHPFFTHSCFSSVRIYRQM